MINRPERAAHFTIALIVLALCGVLTRIASGQDSAPGDRKKAAPAVRESGDGQRDRLGVSVALPAGARAEHVSTGTGRAQVQVRNDSRERPALNGTRGATNADAKAADARSVQSTAAGRVIPALRRPRRGDRGAVNTEIPNLRRVGRGETRRQLPIERVEGPQLTPETASASMLALRGRGAASGNRNRVAPSGGDSGRFITAELARVWIAEGGFRAYRAHAAMAHVLRRHAQRRGWPLQRSIDAEVWRHSNALRDRPWLRRLRADCAEPAGYPWRWPSDRCVVLVARAEAFLRGELPDPCPRAVGWRTPGQALDRALARGFVRLRCGGMGVAFVGEARALTIDAATAAGGRR